MIQEDVRSAAGPRTPEEAIAVVSPRHTWSHTDGTPGEWGAWQFSHGFIVYPDVNLVDATVVPSGRLECYVVDLEASVTAMPYLGVQATALAYLRANGLLAHL